MYETNTKILRNYDEYYSNPFVTRVEYTDNPSTVICGHHRIKEIAAYEDLPTKKRMWVQLIHDSNASNRMINYNPTIFCGTTFPRYIFSSTHSVRYILYVIYKRTIRFVRKILLKMKTIFLRK